MDDPVIDKALDLINEKIHDIALLIKEVTQLRAKLTRLREDVGRYDEKDRTKTREIVVLTRENQWLVAERDAWKASAEEREEICKKFEEIIADHPELLKGEPKNVLEDESDRQMILMALGHLTAARPGWYEALRLIAIRFNGEEMWKNFRDMKQEEGSTQA